MGTAHRSSRLYRSVMMAASMAASLLLGVGAANANVATEPDVPSDSDIRATAVAAIRNAGLEFGLGALLLMQRERREHRVVPKMLPLLATPTPQGHLWVGLARERNAAQPSRGVQLQMWWLVPLGQ